MAMFLGPVGIRIGHFAAFAQLNTTEWQQEQPLPSWSPSDDFWGMLDHGWQWLDLFSKWFGAEGQELK